MNSPPESDSISEFRKACKKRKIRQKAISDAFRVSSATCQRMLSGESEKLRDAIYISNAIMELTGLLPFQLLKKDISHSPRLRLIDKLTKLTDGEVKSLSNYVKLVDQEKDQGKAIFSEIYRVEAFAIISQLYHKIIKVNLTDLTVLPVDIYDKELQSELRLNRSLKISTWLNHNINSDLVYPEHRKIVADYANVDNLQKVMSQTNIDCSLEYMRLIDDDYRWVSMEVMRSSDYTPDSQVILICIKDIQNYNTV